jgi:hypothetical protein
MPSITQYNVEADVEIDVDVDDFLNDCSSREIKEVIDWLRDNDELSIESVPERSKNLMDLEWDKSINKLSLNRTQLTVAEEEFIKSIANRL